jgi:hypothetical protein
MKPKILFKYPTRGRRERFFAGLDSIVNNLADLENFQIQVTADADDKEMAQREVFERIKKYPNTEIIYGISKSKIDAVNRDMPLFRDWDIVVVMSDDMEFRFYGFDEVLRQQFEDENFDKLIHIPDNDARNILAVMYIAGRDFVKRFGYLYNPIYQSLFCDDDIQAVAKRLGCYHYVDCAGLIFHANMAYGHQPKDEMFIRQQEIGWSVDRLTYEKRKSENFGL